MLSRKSLAHTQVKDRSDIGYPRVKLKRDFIATLEPRSLTSGFGFSDVDDNAFSASYGKRCRNFFGMSNNFGKCSSM